MACCPFHNEKTPSFTVSEAKQFYHCFGCGAHGTALGFLMEYDNLEFVDAVEELAAIYHLEVPREQGSQVKKDDKTPLFEALSSANTLFQQQLKQSDRAIEYLKQRGLTGEIAKRYQMGYAPDGWDFLTGKLSKKTQALAQTGMLVKKDSGGFYDRFRDRIMFAITNRRGKVIGFGGRILDKGEPKYLNSPENALFHKGLEVYGLYEAKQANRDLKRIVVVEGYMDVVALAQFGISYAVASLGTATTKEQIQAIFRSSPEIVFCYDGDMAGRKAAWRALENTLAVIRDGQHAKFLFLPEKEDPDSMVRKEGKDAFEERLAQATSLSDYFFEQLTQQCDMSTLEGKAQLAESAKPKLAAMSDSLFKDLLIEKLSSISNISAGKLSTQSAVRPTSATKPASNPNAPTRQQSHSPSGLRSAIALLLQFPDLASEIEIPPSFETCQIKGVPLLAEIYRAANSNPEINSAALLERFRHHEDFSALVKLHLYDVPGITDVETRKELYMDHIQHITSQITTGDTDTRLAELEAKVNASGLASLSADEKKELNALLISR